MAIFFPSRLLWVALVASLFGVWGVVGAGVRVGIYAGDDNGLSLAFALRDLGIFQVVEVIEDGPSLDLRNNFDAILFFTYGAGDFSLVGDQIADFITAGGGVVLASRFALTQFQGDVGRLGLSSPFTDSTTVQTTQPLILKIYFSNIQATRSSISHMALLL